MELDKVIKNRRSIRKFLDKDVSDEQIALILDAAAHAPSAGNVRHCEFIVIRDKTKIEQLIETTPSSQDWIKGAPVCIVVYSDNADIEAMYGKRGLELYSIQDCSAAIENMLLKITDLGLGACWVSGFEDDGVRRVVRLPDNLIPQAIIPIGYPAEEPKEKFIDVEKYVYYENYKGFKRDEDIQKRYKKYKGLKDKVKNIFKKNNAD